MLQAAGAGAAVCITQITNLIQDLGPLYSIPISIASFGAVVGIVSSMIMARRG